LAGLSKDDKHLIGEQLRTHIFPAGTTVYSQGDAGNTIFMIHRGSITIRMDDAITIDELGEGSTFGTSFLFTGELSRKETVVASTELEVLSLTHEVLKQLPEEVVQAAVIDRNALVNRIESRKRAALSLAKTDLVAVRYLGFGNFGRVMLVSHRGTADMYALKSLSKARLVDQLQVQHAISEKRVLEKLNHPFCSALHNVYSDPSPTGDVHILLDVCLGGELFALLQLAKCFNFPAACFYASCVTSALVYLHKESIAYRDLKSENLVIDAKGYPKLIDFGFAKTLRGAERTFTLVGTPQYLAPELVTSSGHGMAVDWWGFGVLVFELLTGQTPFDDSSNIGIYQKIVAGKVTYPSNLRPSAKDLIGKLLISNPVRRLGGTPASRLTVKSEPFFSMYDFARLERLEYAPPWQPTLKHKADTTYFENVDDFHQEEATPSGELSAAFLKDVERLDKEFTQL